MAAWNLEAAADHLGELETSDPGAHAALVGDLGVEAEEVASWRKISAAMFVPFDAELGVHGQDDTFLQKPRWDVAATPPDRFQQIGSASCRDRVCQYGSISVVAVTLQ